MKKLNPTFGVSLNFMEIWYSEDDKSENITDLLECSNAREAFSIGTDFLGLTNVAIRSQAELEDVFKLVKNRSRNFVQKKEFISLMQYILIYYISIQNDSLSAEYRGNLSHFFGRINFINTQEKKQFSFFLVDLIGFDEVLIFL